MVEDEFGAIDAYLPDDDDFGAVDAELSTIRPLTPPKKEKKATTVSESDDFGATDAALNSGYDFLSLTNPLNRMKLEYELLTDFTKGVGQFVLSLPKVLGVSLKEQAELNIQRLEEKDQPKMTLPGIGQPTENFVLSEFLKYKADPKAYKAGKESVDKVIPQKDFPLMTALEERQIKKVSDVADSIIKWNDDLIEKSDWLTPSDKTWAHKVANEIGQGAGSIALSWGLAFATRNPNLAALSFGALQKSRLYEEAREAGKKPSEASTLSTIGGGIEAGLEYIGLDMILKASGKALPKIALRVATEAAQEGSQEFGGNLVTRLGWDNTKDVLQGVGKAALYGAILAAPASVIVSMTEQNGVKDALIEGGMTEKEVDKVLPTIVKAVTEKTAEEIGKLDLNQIIKDYQTKQLEIAPVEKFNVPPVPANIQTMGSPVVGKVGLPERVPAIDDIVDRISRKYTLFAETEKLPVVGEGTYDAARKAALQPRVMYIGTLDSDGELITKNSIKQRMKRMIEDNLISRGVKVHQLSSSDALGIQELVDKLYKYAVKTYVPNVDMQKIIEAKRIIAQQSDVITNQKGEQTIPVIPGASKNVDVKMDKVFDVVNSELSTPQRRAVYKAFTSNLPIGSLMDQYVSVKTALREMYAKAEKVSKEAFKQGVEFTQDQQEVIKQVQKEHEALVDEVTKLQKHLRLSYDNTSIAPEYQVVIRDVLNKFDLKYRASKTYERIARAQAGEKQILQDPFIAELVEKRTMNTMTLGELRLLDDYINNLVRQGTLKKVLRSTTQEKKLEGIVQRMLKTVPSKEAKEFEERDNTIRNKLIDTAKGAYIFGIRPEYVFEMLDAKFGTAFKDEFYAKYALGMRRYLTMKDMAHQALIESYKKANIAKNQLVKKDILIEGRKLSLEDVLTIYANSLNEDNLAYLVENGFDPQDGRKIIKPTEVGLGQVEDYMNTHPEYKTLVNEVMQIFDSIFPDVALTHERVNGLPLNKEQNYYPILTDRNLEFGDSLSAERALRTDAKEIIQARQHGRKPSMTFTRTGKSTQPLINSFTKMASRHVEEASKFVAFAESSKEWTELLKDTRVKEAILAKSGQATYDAIVEWATKTVPTQRLLQEPKTLFAKLTRGLMRNTGIASLGYNILSLLRQPISLVNSINEIDPARPQLIADAALDIAMHPKIIEAINNLSILLKNRVVETDLLKAVGDNSFTPASLKDNVADVAWKAMTFMDGIASYTTFWAAFKKSIVEDRVTDITKAVEAGERAVRRSQSWAVPGDIALSQKGGLLEVLFSQFQNQVNVIYNQNIEAFREFGISKEGAGKLLLRMLWINVIPAILMGMVKRGRLPEKPEDFYDDMLDYSLGQIPILGPSLSTATQGIQGGGGAPALSTIAETAGGVIGLAQGKPTGALRLGRGAATLAGIPYTQPLRTSKGVFKMVTGTVTDPRVLIWDETALKDNAPSKKKKNKKKGFRF